MKTSGFNLRRIIYLVPLILFAGCGESADSGLVIFENNFEGQKGWCAMDHLYEGQGHSGRFSTGASVESEYSSIFRMKFKEISKSGVTWLRFSVWCYAEELPTDALLVLSVDSDTTLKIIWRSWELRKFINSKEKWTQVDGEINLQEKGANKPENTFVFYLYNKGRKKVLADDFHFEFTKN